MKKKQKKKYNILGLKKYNKVLSILIKNKKKNKEKYDINDLRKQASFVYKDYKEVPLKNIKVKDVLSSEEKEIRLEAVDVPNYWFDNQANFTYWFQVGDWANRFANAYPMIPIMLITKATEKQPLVVQGATGDYDGSVFQSWTEGIREMLENPDDSDGEMGIFLGTPAYKDENGQIYAVWFEDGTKIPKLPPKPTEIEPRKKKLIEQREEEEAKRREKEKPKKKRGRKPKSEATTKPLPKVEKKPPIERKPPKKADNEVRLAELRNEALKMLQEDYKLGLYTKKEYKIEREKILNKYDKGGVI